MKKRFPSFLIPTVLPCLLLCMLLLLNETLLGRASTSAYYLDFSRLEISVSPKTNTASGVIKVTSNSSQPIRLKVIPKLWTLSPSGTISYIEAPTNGYNLLDNIGINPEEFELAPQKTRLVRFIVKAPHELDNVEFPFQLYFQPTDLLQAAGVGKETAGVSNLLNVVPIFTTTVYITKGHPTPDVKVEGLQCSYKPDTHQVSVQLNLNNEGTQHARLFGNLLLSQKIAMDSSSSTSSKMVDVLHLQNSTLIVVFPHTPRTVQNSLDLPTASKLDPGQYQGELHLVDERNIQPAIQSTCSFSVGGGSPAVLAN